MKHIKILGKNYSVIKDNTLNVLGETNNTTLCIRYKDQHREQLVDTLLHESLHAIDFACCLKLTEEQIHCLSPVLISLLRENSQLTNLILDKAK